MKNNVVFGTNLTLIDIFLAFYNSSFISWFFIVKIPPILLVIIPYLFIFQSIKFYSLKNELVEKELEGMKRF